MPVLTFQGLYDLAQLLTDAELRASVNPEDVNPPGAWVTLEQVQQRNLAADLRLQVVVYLIAPNVDHRRAMDTLAELYNTARTVLTPDGPVVSQGVILPSAPTDPLPALRIPLYLSGTAELA